MLAWRGGGKNALSVEIAVVAQVHENLRRARVLARRRERQEAWLILLEHLIILDPAQSLHRERSFTPVRLYLARFSKTWYCMLPTAHKLATPGAWNMAHGGAWAR